MNFINLYEEFQHNLNYKSVIDEWIKKIDVFAHYQKLDKNTLDKQISIELPINLFNELYDENKTINFNEFYSNLENIHNFKKDSIIGRGSFGSIIKLKIMEEL